MMMMEEGEERAQQEQGERLGQLVQKWEQKKRERCCVICLAEQQGPEDGNGDGSRDGDGGVAAEMAGRGPLQCVEGHIVCRGCIVGYTKSLRLTPHRLEEGRGYGAGGDRRRELVSVQVPCPVPECDAVHDSRDLVKRGWCTDRNAVAELEQALVEREQKLRRHVEDLMTFKCPAPACRMAQDPSPDGCCAMTCNACGQFYCLLCLEMFASSEAGHAHCQQAHGDVFHTAEHIAHTHKQLRINALARFCTMTPMLLQHAHRRSVLLRNCDGLLRHVDILPSAVEEAVQKRLAAPRQDAKEREEKMTGGVDGQDDNTDGGSGSGTAIDEEAKAEEREKNPEQQGGEEEEEKDEASELGARLARVAFSGSEAAVVQVLRMSRSIDCNAMCPGDASEGRCVLHCVVQHHMLDALHLLVEERGVFIDPCDFMGNTPLFYAVHFSFLDAVPYLLEHGASLYPALTPGCPASEPCRPFDAAVRHEARDIVTLFLEHMTAEQISDKLWPDIDDLTPLLLAIVQGSVPIVQRVLDAGASPNRLSRVGLPPLHAAAFYGFAQIVRTLLDGGANVNMRNIQQRTALSVAVEKGFDPRTRRWNLCHRQACQPLLERGASLDDARQHAPRAFLPGFDLLEQELHAYVAIAAAAAGGAPPPTAAAGVAMPTGIVQPGGLPAHVGAFGRRPVPREADTGMVRGFINHIRRMSAQEILASLAQLAVIIYVLMSSWSKFTDGNDTHGPHLHGHQQDPQRMNDYQEYLNTMQRHNG